MTITLNFLLIYSYKSHHDNFPLIVSTLLICFFMGLFLKLVRPNSKAIIQNLAWGLLYGSVTIIILTVTFITWVACLYNN